MNGEWKANRQRLDDLCADRATVGLSAAEEAEFRTLLSFAPDLQPDTFELTAALIDLTFADDLNAEPPPHLKERLRSWAKTL